MYLFQRAEERFERYYRTFRLFEYDERLFALSSHKHRRPVYLDDYLLGWLVFGDGIEACGGDFAVLMQLHSVLLIRLMSEDVPSYDPDHWEDEDGKIHDYDNFPHGELPERKSAHPISALGTSPAGQRDLAYNRKGSLSVQCHTGSIHPAFLREWFDYLAALEPRARKDEWYALWQARCDAVVMPE